jgi:hypothetical protein
MTLDAVHIFIFKHTKQEMWEQEQIGLPSAAAPPPHPTVGIGRSAQHLPLYLRLCAVSSLHVTVSVLKKG